MQWPWKSALSRAWSSPPNVFFALFWCWTQALYGVGKGESRDSNWAAVLVSTRFSYPRVCLLGYSQPDCYFHFSNYFFCCCFRVSHIWLRLGQFFPTGYSWGGKTLQSVQQVSGGGKVCEACLYFITAYQNQRNLVIFVAFTERYLLFSTKECRNKLVFLRARLNSISTRSSFCSWFLVFRLVF